MKWYFGQNETFDHFNKIVRFVHLACIVLKRYFYVMKCYEMIDQKWNETTEIKYRNFPFVRFVLKFDHFCRFHNEQNDWNPHP